MSLITRSTKILLLLVALCFSNVLAHTYLSSVYLDNTALDEGDCVRPHPSTAFDSPIPLVTSADMTCGWLPEAAEAANRKCPIAAGSSIGIQWHHNSDAASDDIIDSSHKGPVMVYLAKSDDGSGSVWFKIYEDGYTDGAWGVDRLLANGGRVDVTIPSDIAPGNYLLRGEIIALHGAYVLDGSQPYVGCVELTITGTGSATPATVAFPGAYSDTDPGLYLSIYNGLTSYTIPGPAVYTAGSSTSTTAPTSAATTAPTSAATTAPTTTPTSAATTAPTTAPTSAATTKPTTAPTSAATTKPTSAATTAPTSAATTAPTSSATSTVKVQVNSGSNTWWFAVAVSGGSEDTVKAELFDSGVVPSFSIMVKASYGFYFSQSVQLTLPISLRLTSASGKQVVLEDFITSFTDSSVKDTNQDYSTSVTPAPTSKATSKPTTSATTAPTSGTTVKFQQHSGNSAWWFAVAVSGVDASQISKVELQDSNSVSSFSPFASTDWGYYIFSTTGVALVAPVNVRVTTTAGLTATATFSDFTGSSVASASL